MESLDTGPGWPRRWTAQWKTEKADVICANVTEIAREPGVSPEGLRGWVKQAEIDRGEGPAGALTGDECDELRCLRRESAEVKKANEVLARAAAFFGKELVNDRIRRCGETDVRVREAETEALRCTAARVPRSPPCAGRSRGRRGVAGSGGWWRGRPRRDRRAR
ncbi:transposase [Streptomyces sp. NL15-2K]|uniref:transposase n=1 Tax=Streptomyces sp. NL15-2K TaxID=376149 RepID=UPI0035B557D1